MSSRNYSLEGEPGVLGPGKSAPQGRSSQTGCGTLVAASGWFPNGLEQREPRSKSAGPGTQVGTGHTVLQFRPACVLASPAAKRLKWPCSPVPGETRAWQWKGRLRGPAGTSQGAGQARAQVPLPGRQPHPAPASPVKGARTSGSTPGGMVGLRGGRLRVPAPSRTGELGLLAPGLGKPRASPLLTDPAEQRRLHSPRHTAGSQGSHRPAGH